MALYCSTLLELFLENQRDNQIKIHKLNPPVLSEGSYFCTLERKSKIKDIKLWKQ